MRPTRFGSRLELGSSRVRSGWQRATDRASRTERTRARGVRDDPRDGYAVVCRSSGARTRSAARSSRLDRESRPRDRGLARDRRARTLRRRADACRGPAGRTAGACSSSDRASFAAASAGGRPTRAGWRGAPSGRAPRVRGPQTCGPSDGRDAPNSQRATAKPSARVDGDGMTTVNNSVGCGEDASDVLFGEELGR